MTPKTPIILLGHTGLLGQAFKRQLPSNFTLIPLSRQDLDLTHPQNIPSQLSPYVSSLCIPPIIINCAAYTQVDACETEIEIAYALNAIAPGALAQFCAQSNLTLVHFSTDYIFDGQGEAPYLEDHPPCPINTYGKSKLAGEKAIQASGCNALIFRIQWLYGSPGKNFITTILEKANPEKPLQIVDDQWGSPSWVDELASTIFCALHHQIPLGTYHLASQGYTTWFRVAQKALELRNNPYLILPVDSSAFPRPAKRPFNSRLSLQKIMALNLPFVPSRWEIALEKYLSLV